MWQLCYGDAKQVNRKQDELNGSIKIRQGHFENFFLSFKFASAFEMKMKNRS